jgi:hypothetical protein
MDGFWDIPAFFWKRYPELYITIIAFGMSHLFLSVLQLEFFHRLRLTGYLLLGYV